jgi:hypothetical protein
MRNGRCPVAEALDEPLVVVEINEVGDLSPCLLEVFEVEEPEAFLLHGPHETLGHAVALGLGDEGVGEFDSEPARLAFENVGCVGAQWELLRALARRDEGFAGVLRPGAYTSTPLQRRSLTFLTALQAAFRTNTGSSRSASRYAMRNGGSIGPSPGLPRGGGIADRCCSAPQFPELTECRPESKAEKVRGARP